MKTRPKDRLQCLVWGNEKKSAKGEREKDCQHVRRNTWSLAGMPKTCFEEGVNSMPQGAKYHEN